MPVCRLVNTRKVTKNTLYSLYFCNIFQNILFVIILSCIYIYRHTQKRRPRCCLIAKRGLRITLKPNKQQETYADMTKKQCYKNKASYKVISIGIYCYFASGFNHRKLRSFVWPIQSVNKRYFNSRSAIKSHRCHSWHNSD